MNESQETKAKDVGNSRRRQLFRIYLAPSRNRIDKKTTEELEMLSVRKEDIKIFKEEWIRAIESAKDTRQLKGINESASYIESGGLSTANYAPQVNGGPKYEPPKRLSTAHNPEYDDVRRTFGEKLKALGLSEMDSNIAGYSGIDLFHPDPYEEYVYPVTRMETKGIIFKKQVKVTIQKQAKRYKPFSQLLEDLLRYDQPQPAPEAPKA